MELEHQRCYVYQPNSEEERPSKRQRVGKASFQPQLKERIQTYRTLWADQEQRIQVRAICIPKDRVTDINRTHWKKLIVPHKEASLTLLLQLDHHQTSQNSPYLLALSLQAQVLHLMDLTSSDWDEKLEQIQTAHSQY